MNLQDILSDKLQYEHTKRVVSIGVDVYPEERKKGYGTEGMRKIMDHARVLGYRIIQDQVRTDNRHCITSIDLINRWFLQHQDIDRPKELSDRKNITAGRYP